MSVGVPLKRFTRMNVSNLASGLVQAPFGIPLVFGYDSHLPSTPVYGVTTDYLLSAGVSADDPGYKAVAAIQAQSPVVNSIGVLKRLANVAQADLITVPASPVAGAYVVTINGIAITVTDPANQAGLQSSLVSGINGNATLAALLTAAPSGNNVTLTADAAGVGFTTAQTSPPATPLIVSTTQANVNGATQVTASYATDQTWYALIPVDSSDLGLPDIDLTQFAAALEVMESIGVLQSSNANVLDATLSSDPFSVLKTAGYTRTMAVWSTDVQPTAAAMAGRNLAYDGTTLLTTWANKTLAGITASITDDAKFQALVGKNGNGYVAVVNRSTAQGSYTRDGKMCAVLNAKQRLGIDIFVSLCRSAMFKAATDKSEAGDDLVFTDGDIQILADSLRSIAGQMTTAKLFKTAPLLTVPSADSQTNTSTGLVTGFKFSGAKAESILYTEINAALS